MLKFLLALFVLSSVALAEDAPKPDVPVANAETEAVIDEEAGIDEDLPEEYDESEYDDLDMSDDGMADEDMEDLPMDDEVPAAAPGGSAEVPAEGAAPVVEEPKPEVPKA